MKCRKKKSPKKVDTRGQLLIWDLLCRGESKASITRLLHKEYGLTRSKIQYWVDKMEAKDWIVRSGQRSSVITYKKGTSGEPEYLRTLYQFNSTNLGESSSKDDLPPVDFLNSETLDKFKLEDFEKAVRTFDLPVVKTLNSCCRCHGIIATVRILVNPPIEDLRFDGKPLKKSRELTGGHYFYMGTPFLDESIHIRIYPGTTMLIYLPGLTVYTGAELIAFAKKTEERTKTIIRNLELQYGFELGEFKLSGAFALVDNETMRAFSKDIKMSTLEAWNDNSKGPSEWETHNFAKALIHLEMPGLVQQLIEADKAKSRRIKALELDRDGFDDEVP